MAKENDIKVVKGRTEEGNNAEIYVSRDKSQNRITVDTFDDKVYLTVKEAKELIKVLQDSIKYKIRLKLRILKPIVGMAYLSDISKPSLMLLIILLHFRLLKLTIRHINDCEVNCMHTYFLPTQNMYVVLI